MAINITKVLDEIQTRLDDSTQTDRSLTALIAASNRIDNSGTGVLTYRSTGHLPQYTDSAYYGTIAYVEADNVFGDSSGRFYYGSSRDSGWIPFTTLQDSDEAAIPLPAAAVVFDDYSNWPGGVLQGSNYGFNHDRLYDDQYPYASDANATNNYPTGNLGEGAGISGSEHGYTVNGGPSAFYIYKYQYSNNTFTDPAVYYNGPANLPNSQRNPSNLGGGGQSSAHGYYHGVGPSPVGNSVQDSVKFPFAADDAATVIEGQHSLNYSNQLRTVSSPAATYSQGGYDLPASPPHKYWDILKMPFASDGTMTVSGQVGNIDYDTSGGGNGSMSTTRGYFAGHADTGNGANSPNQIFRIEFSSDGDGTDVGDLSVARGYTSGTSSTTHGYSMGGQNSTTINTIDKYPFASEGNASDVGDLSTARNTNGGFMY